MYALNITSIEFIHQRNASTPTPVGHETTVSSKHRIIIELTPRTPSKHKSDGSTPPLYFLFLIHLSRNVIAFSRLQLYHAELLSTRLL